MSRVLPPLLAFSLALTLFLPTLGYGFMGLDDPQVLESVPFVHERSLENLRILLARPIAGSWHPLHQASYALDATLLGYGPFAFHVGNVVIYALVAALVALLARELGASPLAAGAAALIFAVHPAHVENVAWISARKDLLSGAFGLASLCAYVRRPGSARTYGLALVLMALALLAKSVCVMLTFVLVAKALIERRLDRREALRLAPFLLLGLAALVGLARSQAAAGAVVGPFGGAWSNQLRLCVRTLAHYVGSAVFPFEHTVKPPFPTIEPPLGLADLGSALVLLAALVALVVGARRQRPWALPLAIFFLTLAPVSNIVPFPAFTQDRYLFLPTVGLALACGDAFAALAVKRRALAFTLLGIVLAVLGANSFVAERAWRSDMDLWANAVERNPEDLDALEGLGRSLIQAGEKTQGTAEAEGSAEKITRGVSLLKQVLVVAPLRLDANMQLATLLLKRGDVDGARAHLLAASAGSANFRWTADVVLAQIAVDRDDLGGAEVCLARARAQAPAAPDVQAGLARLAIAQGRPDAARRFAEAAIAGEPGHGALRITRAAALRALGAREEALAELGRARSHGASDAEVAPLFVLLALDRGDRDAARAALATLSPRAGETAIARARLAALDGNAATARILVANAVASLGSGALREARAEPDLAAALGGN